ncbi:hypothetical protein, partial [Thiocapsa sp. C2-2m]|uniref:hypothetical protein n=1 Tax=Thiocapsa sp. C2-2m TaxID=3137395 RepID=UPI0035B4E6DC
ATESPLWVARISGSAPRLPIRITVLIPLMSSSPYVRRPWRGGWGLLNHQPLAAHQARPGDHLASLPGGDALRIRPSASSDH